MLMRINADINSCPTVNLAAVAYVQAETLLDIDHYPTSILPDLPTIKVLGDSGPVSFGPLDNIALTTEAGTDAVSRADQENDAGSESESEDDEGTGLTDRERHDASPLGMVSLSPISPGSLADE
jgi:hypothetical protein